mgnify:CR=1 FL=1
MTRLFSAPPSASLLNSDGEEQSGFQKFLAGFVFLCYVAGLMTIFYVIAGCTTSPPPRLPNHFQNEAQTSKVIQDKFSAHPQGRLPVGLAILADGNSTDGPPAFTEDSWPQFAARVKQKVQGLLPVTMNEVIRLENIPSGEKTSRLAELGGNTSVDVVLVVLPSSQEARGPAQYDVLPEVSMVPGYQTENHATVELGFLDLHSGKLLLQAQGTSYAMLDQLNVPLASSRYPRVRGSAMTSPIYPQEEQALETLRFLAMEEALDQATMKLAQQWPDGVGGSVSTGRPSSSGSDS